MVSASWVQRRGEVNRPVLALRQNCPQSGWTGEFLVTLSDVLMALELEL